MEVRQDPSRAIHRPCRRGAACTAFAVKIAEPVARAYCFGVKQESELQGIGRGRAVFLRFPSGWDSLFRARLDQFINKTHELVVLADKIDWVAVEPSPEAA